MSHRDELSALIDRVVSREPLLTVPVFVPPPELRIDGVRHDLGDAVVLQQREAFPGSLSWSLQLVGVAAERILAFAPALVSGRPPPAVAARIFAELRIVCLRAARGEPRFALNTIDRVVVGPAHVRLVGGCAPILPIAPPSV